MRLNSFWLVATVRAVAPGVTVVMAEPPALVVRCVTRSTIVTEPRTDFLGKIAQGARSKPLCRRAVRHNRRPGWWAVERNWKARRLQPDLADVGAVGDGAADRIGGVVADDEVEVRAIRTEGVITGGADLGTRLPPPMLRAHDVWCERVVQTSACADAAVGRFDVHPVARVNSSSRGSVGVK